MLPKCIKKETIFYFVCFALVGLTIAFTLNLWYKYIPVSYVDKYIFILLFTIIGLSLLPFADKLKIGNFLEIERLKDKIEEVKHHQYLGETIRTSNGEVLYFDEIGLHQLPDNETASFLRTNKGDLFVKKEILEQMKWLIRYKVLKQPK